MPTSIYFVQETRRWGSLFRVFFRGKGGRSPSLDPITHTWPPSPRVLYNTAHTVSYFVYFITCLSRETDKIFQKIVVDLQNVTKCYFKSSPRLNWLPPRWSTDNFIKLNPAHILFTSSYHHLWPLIPQTSHLFSLHQKTKSTKNNTIIAPHHIHKYNNKIYK